MALKVVSRPRLGLRNRCTPTDNPDGNPTLVSLPPRLFSLTGNARDSLIPKGGGRAVVRKTDIYHPLPRQNRPRALPLPRQKQRNPTFPASALSERTRATDRGSFRAQLRADVSLRRCTSLSFFFYVLSFASVLLFGLSRCIQKKKQSSLQALKQATLLFLHGKHNGRLHIYTDDSVSLVSSTGAVVTRANYITIKVRTSHLTSSTAAELTGIRAALDGPEWIDRRRSLNNVFLKTKTVTDNVPVFNDVITDLLDRWQESRNDNGILENVERELYNWSIESLGAMIFGRRLGCIAQSSSMENVHEFVHCVQQIFNESAKMAMFSPRLAYRLRLPVWRRFVRAAGRALELARDYVEENLNAIAKDPSSAAQHNQGILSQLLLNEKITEEELVRIVTDLFLAAADTTSHATQWALYLLAKHPEQQERLLHSVHSVLPEGQPINEESLARLPYVKAVIREALRLYPVAPFLTRILSEDIVLDGYHIPAGVGVWKDLYP
ncbi:hypothetical protein HPB51_017464 [Rhipicephalus microplus]|uniref:Cytochrome n=1 Tax=Rhipicephalus microplus TaxID=6941 RepID=A0A9J6F4C3_RHIMP|nr:hypothetical protein HPB51_017464 [Rhipicephalus microplus]